MKTLSRRTLNALRDLAAETAHPQPIQTVAYFQFTIKNHEDTSTFLSPHHHARAEREVDLARFSGIENPFSLASDPSYTHALQMFTPSTGRSWLDWLTRDTIRKFVYCEIDAKTRFMKKALQRGEL